MYATCKALAMAELAASTHLWLPASHIKRLPHVLCHAALRPGGALSDGGQLRPRVRAICRQQLLPRTHHVPQPVPLALCNSPSHDRAH